MGVSASERIRGALESCRDIIMPLPGEVSTLLLLLLLHDFVIVCDESVSIRMTLSISRLAPLLLPPPHLHLMMMASMSESAAADNRTPVNTLSSSTPASA